MALRKVSDGDPVVSSPIMEDFGLLGKHVLINYLNSVLVDTGSFVLDDGVYLFSSSGVSDLSYLDTANSTCFYDEQGTAAFCDVLDLFDDGSVDTAIWTTPVSGTAYSKSVTESSGYLQCYVSAYSDENQSGTADAISNGSSGLNINGQDAEIIFTATLSTNDLSGISKGAAYIMLSDGSSDVTLYSQINADATNTFFFRLVYDDATQTVDVYRNDVLVSDDVDVSSLGVNKFLKFRAYAVSGGSNVGHGVGYIQVYGVGYVKEGVTSGSTSFVSPSVSLTDNHDTAIGYFVSDHTISNSSMSVSFDGGTTFSSNTYKLVVKSSVAGNSLVFKVTGDKPTTVDTSTTNIPLLISAGVLYD